MAALWLRSGKPPSLPLGHTFSVSLFAVVCDAMDGGGGWIRLDAIGPGREQLGRIRRAAKGPVYVRIVCTDRE
jgi:hypothetical protein